MASGASIVVDKTREYLRQPAVVGFEEPFLDHLARDFAALGCQVDRREKLLAVWRGPRQPHILCVHVDRHGLVGTGGGEYEYAAFVARLARYGDERAASRKMLETIRDRFLHEDVFAYRPSDGQRVRQGAIGDAYFCERRLNLVFRVDGFEDLPVGTPVAFSPACQVDDGRITGQLDNAVSAAFAYALFARGFSGRAVFTAEEEIGKSWTFTRDYLLGEGLASRSLLVMDTSPFPDDDAIVEGWAILRRRDANGEFEPSLVARLQAICEQERIPYRFKDAWIEAQNREREQAGQSPLGYGSTELGRLVAGSQGELNGATLQLPTFGYHSNRETTSVRAIGNLLTLLERTLDLV